NDVPKAATPAAEWLEYTALTTFKSFPNIRPQDDAWDSTYGVGKLYSQPDGTLIRAPLRGGDWSNGAVAGAFTAHFNSAPSSTNASIGFRCAR
ncbi:MAG: hypothetical protein WDZ40_00645, partial [Candidatus Spechtbacterales bacterium]